MSVVLRGDQQPRTIEDELRQSFLDYSMSVIISRALPDVRDGLKPVHRRILITLNDLNLQHNRGFRKCAKIAGDVSGNYHPHGEGVVYPSIVRLAQTFSMRYPLVDGQGNFGSVDGDAPAAMRYTEARMTAIAEEMLRDLEKETVDFIPNYDETRNEPVVLPCVIPNLLMNGSTGIAVGMATNIPPHNLSELCTAFLYLLDHPEATIADLMAFLSGPDFPTGGFIYGRAGIREAYATGRGLIQLRARVNVEVSKRTTREAIIITEIPYQVNKAKLVERIAELVKEKKIDGVADLRDESDRSGMRVVIELRRDEVASVIINQLYKHTQMQVTFGVIMLALVDNQPRVLTLRELMDYFLAHRQEVVIRRTRYDLDRARERAHILAGLKIALDNLDRVIALIRAAQSPQAAREQLVAAFAMSERQAQAILELRLQRLTALQREEILRERDEVLATIAELERILADPEKVRGIIKGELAALRDTYGDERRTEIIDEAEELDYEDLIIEEDMVVTISHTGYIKRNASSQYRSQHRGGKGSTGMTTREEDFVEYLFIASTHDYILFFTSLGRVYWLKVYDIPQAGRAARGKAIVNLLQLSPGEHVRAYVNVRDFQASRFVILATRRGIVKKVTLEAFKSPRAGGIIALTLDEADDLVGAALTDGNRTIILGTRNGMAIRFRDQAVRPMGRTARGIIGIRLAADDEVVGAEVISPNTSLLTVTEHGYGKRTEINSYRLQGRGGRGTIDIKTTPRNGKVVNVRQVLHDDDVMLITALGVVIRMGVESIREIGRNTQGVRLIDLAEGDQVVSVARLAEK
ncbi:MAG: DNA gyrase subunit A [Candidatus Tectomicrobia bacterium]|nr:DNA gyrase subunit A [Candidatus Tectomicrobia bacterium]